MDSVLDTWIQKGITHIFTTSSHFGFVKGIQFSFVSDEKDALSLALGWVKATGKFVGVLLETHRESPHSQILIETKLHREIKNNTICPPSEDLENIKRQIEVSRRPCLVFGEMQNLDPLLSLKIPILATPESLDNFVEFPDSFYGRVGIYGDLVGNMILQNSDLVILCGKTVLEKIKKEWFVREGHVIHIGNFSPSIQCHGFVSSLDKIWSIIKNKKILPDWRRTCSDWRDEWIHMFPSETGIGIDPYLFYASFHQMWEEKSMFVKKDKWFPPAFQQGILNINNKFVPVPPDLYPIKVAQGFFSQNQENPLFVFADQSSYSIEHIQQIEENPIPIVIFFLKENRELSILSGVKTSIEKCFLDESSFSPEMLLFETLPLLVEVNLTDHFTPYPKGSQPFENMSPFEEDVKHKMIISPYLKI